MVSVTVVRPAPRLDDEPELAKFLDGQPRFSEHKWIDLVAGPPGRRRSASSSATTTSTASSSATPTPRRTATTSGASSWPCRRRSSRSRCCGPSSAGSTAPAGPSTGGCTAPSRATTSWPSGSGLLVGRDLLQMHVDLPVAPPTWPPGVRVAPFRPGVDDATWLAVNARSFAGHPEQGRVDQAQLDARKEEAVVRPRGLPARLGRRRPRRLLLDQGPPGRARGRDLRHRRRPRPPGHRARPGPHPRRSRQPPRARRADGDALRRRRQRGGRPPVRVDRVRDPSTAPRAYVR